MDTYHGPAFTFREPTADERAQLAFLVSQAELPNGSALDELLVADMQDDGMGSPG
jgi:hypothetical protein